MTTPPHQAHADSPPHKSPFDHTLQQSNHTHLTTNDQRDESEDPAEEQHGDYR